MPGTTTYHPPLERESRSRRLRRAIASAVGRRSGSIELVLIDVARDDALGDWYVPPTPAEIESDLHHGRD